MPSFLSIGLLGLAFFVLSSLVGGHSSHGDIDIDHSGDYDDSSGEQQDAFAISQFFTIRNLFLFIAGFGSVGEIAEYFGANPVTASFFGVLGGLSLVAIVVVIYYFVRKQDSNTVYSGQDVVGKTGNIITPIPKEGQGEIVVNDNTGLPRCFFAVSDTPITSGKVVVKSVVGNVATVVPAV